MNTENEKSVSFTYDTFEKKTGKNLCVYLGVITRFV